VHHRHAGNLLLLDVDGNRMVSVLVEFVLSIGGELVSEQLEPIVVVVVGKRGTGKNDASGQREDSAAIKVHHGCFLM
jgi:hypothetical protein